MSALPQGYPDIVGAQPEGPPQFEPYIPAERNLREVPLAGRAGLRCDGLPRSWVAAGCRAAPQSLVLTFVGTR